ncbi:MAG: antibiotic biosynthesis monooxygenase family protein [Dongiaceae bacterium]
MSMIARIFRVQALPGKQRAWQEKVEAISLPWPRRQPGLIAFYPGRSLEPESRWFSMTSIWRDLEAIQTAFGVDWQPPLLLGDEPELVEAMEVQHYAVVGREEWRAGALFEPRRRRC